jgi:hypothetical protein
MKFKTIILVSLATLMLSACSAEETDPLYMVTEEEAAAHLENDFTEEERKALYLESMQELRASADLPQEELAEFLKAHNQSYAESLGSHKAVVLLGEEAMDKGWFAEVPK